VDIVLIPLLQVINTVIHLYIWAIIISVILNWLILFNIINTHNRFIAVVADFLYRLTEPPLALIRKALPNLGGLDLSPLVLILVLYFLEIFFDRLILRILHFS
jgi:YggT family protein